MASTDATFADATRFDAGGLDTCAGRSRWVYLLTYDQELLRYRPSEDNEVVRVGTIRCPDTAGGEPFDPNAHNMTLDRSGRAWLFDQGGALYHVDTSDAACTGTSFEVDQDEFEFLGATFVHDPSATSETTPEERLIVSGGPSGTEASWSDAIATIDTDTLTMTELSRAGGDGSVLLASSGDGVLWSVRADGDGSTLYATDPIEGTVGERIGTIPAVIGFQSSVVFWGGRFYVFVPESGSDQGTLVYSYTPSTTAWDFVLRVPQRIVGTGVSTCAPVTLI